jgi:hypothetical protein
MESIAPETTYGAIACFFFATDFFGHGVLNLLFNDPLSCP